jgi:hypothetical protein
MRTSLPIFVMAILYPLRREWHRFVFPSVVAARNSADHRTRVRHVFDAKAVIALDHYPFEILIPTRCQLRRRMAEPTIA